MSSAASMHRPGGPAVGLPDGVYLGSRGRRLVAYLIDAIVPDVLVLLGVVNLGVGGPGWLTVVLWVLVVLWLVLLLWMYGKLAAGPGMRLMHLQLVGLRNGRPIGLGRTFIRGVLLALMTDITILLIIMVILMWRQPRRQGWHDLVADSVVIEERPLAPLRPGETRDPRVWIRQLFSRSERQPHEPPAVAGSQPRPAIDAGPVPSQERQPESQPEPQPEPQHASEPEPVAEQQTTVHPAAVAAEPPQPAPPNIGWAVVLDGAREIPITRLTIFGRNPQPRPGEDDAQLIKVVDEARTVSKTHVAVNVDSRGVFVTDRGSTNGSAVTDPQGVYNLIAAEQPVRLGGEGYVISFGSHHLRLIRH